MESSRINFAKDAGLPDTASWSEINVVNSEISRRKSAKDAGLPDTASWSEINNTH